jgi:hypothetical protein
MFILRDIAACECGGYAAGFPVSAGILARFIKNPGDAPLIAVPSPRLRSPASG